MLVETFQPKVYNNSMVKLENYITVSDFAKMAGVSTRAIHKAMKDKRIKDVKRVGYIYLINRSEIASYKESKR